MTAIPLICCVVVRSAPWRVFSFSVVEYLSTAEKKKPQHNPRMMTLLLLLLPHIFAFRVEYGLSYKKQEKKKKEESRFFFSSFFSLLVPASLVLFASGSGAV